MKHLKTFEEQDRILEKKKAGKKPPFWLKKGKKKDDKEEDGEKETKSKSKGLSAKQKKLPEALRKAIAARKK